MSQHGPRPWIIAYDVACPKRLRRVAKCCEKHGVRLQKSLFHTVMTEINLRKLAEALRRLIDEQEDDLRIYCPASGLPIEWIGAAPLAQDLLYTGLVLQLDLPRCSPEDAPNPKGPPKALKGKGKAASTVRTQP